MYGLKWTVSSENVSLCKMHIGDPAHLHSLIRAFILSQLILQKPVIS